MRYAIANGTARQLLLSLVLVLAMLWSPLPATSPAESPERVSSDELAVSRPPAQNGVTDVEPADSALPDGHFYRQGAVTSSPLFGFAVTGSLWAAFERAGGVATFGFPISRQWTDAEGQSNQAFQYGLLRLASAAGEAPRVERVNVLDALGAAGKDAWLGQAYQVPPDTTRATDGQQAPERSVDERLALLKRDPEIRQAFLSQRDWRERFGLPVAIERYDGVVTLRAQRAILRHWLRDAPQAAAGAVTVTDGAQVAKEAGLVPEQAARPMVSPLHGWLHVDGRQIVDGRGQPVRLTGINWTGFELRDFVPRGLAVRDYRPIVDRLAELGFNTIRLPFSNELVERDPVPNQSLVAACPECQGKKALEIMDLIVDYAAEKGLRVILDNHFSAASDQKGAVLWYTQDYPESAWIKDWQLLAERYRENPAVIGFDLRNEPHGPASWGSGDPATDWRLAAEKAGNAILTINPQALIIVEGIEQYPKPEGGMDLTWWGGNLLGARQFPVRLPATNLLYSPHDYGPTLWKQSWFNQGTTADSLRAVWKHYWLYLNLDQDLPLLVGELGTGNKPSDVADGTPGSQGQWFQAMVSLLGQRDNLHWLYWTVDAGDVYTLFDDSYAKIANEGKLAALSGLMGQKFPLFPRSLGAAQEPDPINPELKIRMR